MEDTRTTLLLRLRLGERPAWFTFNRLYRPILIGYARGRGLSAADADDVVQQVMLAVVRSIEAYEHRGSFRAWLFNIAECRVIDFLRRRREECPLDESGCSGSGATTDPREIWEQHWRDALVQFGLEELRAEVSERAYSVFEDYALRGHPAPIVAERHGIKAGQVYVIKHRLTARLGRILDELMDGELPEAAA